MMLRSCALQWWVVGDSGKGERGKREKKERVRNKQCGVDSAEDPKKINTDIVTPQRQHTRNHASERAKMKRVSNNPQEERHSVPLVRQ
jgi:hypothetical protein